MKNYEIIYSSEKGFYREEVDSIPEVIGDDEVVVSPKLVGVCGSDLFQLRTFKGDNLKLGHEWVGNVIKAGKNSGFNVNDKVTSGALLRCGKCESCIETNNEICINQVVLGEDIGALRTWLKFDKKHLYNINKFSYEAGVLIEVAAVGIAAMECLQSISKNKNKLLVVGAGPIGVFTALTAKKMGYDVTVVELAKKRVKLSNDLGLKTISFGEALLNKKYVSYFQSIIDCSGDNHGKPGFWKYLLNFAKPKADIVIVAKYADKYELESNLFSNKNLTVKWMRGIPNTAIDDTISMWETDMEEVAKIIITSVVENSRIENMMLSDKYLSDGELKVVLKI